MNMNLHDIRSMHQLERLSLQGNAAQAINLVAYSWGLSNLTAGDEVPSFNSFLLLFSN